VKVHRLIRLLQELVDESDAGELEVRCVEGSTQYRVKSVSLIKGDGGRPFVALVVR
jgi:hypothetical protein